MLARMPQPPPGWLSDTGEGLVSVPARTVPVVASALSAWTLVVVAWLVVIGAAVLVLRAVVSEPLDGEQDESDDEVSGH